MTSALKDAVNELNYKGDCTDYTLNYSYKCQNEPSDQTSNNNVSFKSNELDKVSVNIKCPIGNVDDIKPICIATNLSDSQKSQFSSNTNPNTCSYPIYNVPNYYSSSQLENMAETQYSNEYNNI